MGAARLSIAGLMTIVGVVALDCAVLVHGVDLGDRPQDMAMFLLVGVLPVVNVVGVAMLLLLRPPARRKQPTQHPTAASHPDP
jgi:hypothetical protein